MEKQPTRWSGYYEKTKNLPPHESLVEALKLVSKKDAALDLGAGAMRDTKYLLDAGFERVIAVDAEAIHQAGEISDNRLEIVVATFESFEFPENTFDLVNAQFSLPFTSPESFTAVFNKVKNSLKESGIFVGQFFGKNDEWSNDPKMTFHSPEEVGALLSGMKVLSMKEEERDGPTAAGTPKHWHIFYITARK